MAIDLINIDNIVLADDFETWLDRSNEIIDALNPLQLYDFYDGGYATVDNVFPTIPGYTTVQDLSGSPAATTLGLKITRDVRFLGDMLIEILPETPLGFNTATGALTFVFTGPNAPPLLGTSCAPPDRIERNDLYIVYDFDANVTKIVEAEDMLPSIIRCDHQFGEIGTPVTITIKGDLVVDGTQTILSTTNVASLDNNIELNALNALELIDNTNYVSGEDYVFGESVSGQTSGTSAQVISWTPAAIGFPGSVLVVANTAGVFVDGEDVLGGAGGALITIGSQAPPVPTLPAGDDTIAEGGGITLLSTDGNKTMFWSNAGDRWVVNQGWEIDPNFSLFTTTIEPQNNVLDLIGFGSPDAIALHFHDGNDGTGRHWRFFVDSTGTPNFPYTPGNYPTGATPGVPTVLDGTLSLAQASGGTETVPTINNRIIFDGISITNDPGVGAAKITGFARNLNADLLDGCHADPIPTPFFIPCADATGQIDPGWIPFRSNIKEINQIAHGFTVGQVLRIDKITPFGYILAQADTLDNAEAVGVVEAVVDLDNFEINLRGCIEATTAEWDAVTGDTGGLTPGGVYFLDKTTAGRMTLNDPIPGDISKTMMVAIDATTAIVMNYVGGLTDLTSGTPIIELRGDVLALGLLGSPIIATIIERTQQLTAVGVNLPLNVEDSNGVGFRTFEVAMTANTTLEITLLPNIATHATGWDNAASPNRHTNSVTIVITQDGTGGHTPTIAVSGGTIVWDNSASQPVAQTLANKTTVYTLINGTSNPTVWYGARAVFEL